MVKILGAAGSGRRRARVSAVIVSVVALLGIFLVPAAFAVHDTGAFELDGNAVNGAVAGDDWDNV